MNFTEMKLIDGELGRLEASAENAGKHNATWLATLAAIHESLSKCCGHSCHREELRSDRAYEVCRAALFVAWSKGAKEQPPKEGANDTTSCNACTPNGRPAVCQPVDQQGELFNTSEQ